MKQMTGIVSDIPAFLITPVVKEVKEVEGYFPIRPVRVVDAYTPTTTFAYVLVKPKKNTSWVDRALNICAPLVKGVK